MKKGRHKKVRYVQKMPSVEQFSPRGKPGRPDEIELKIDEFEALKLADYQGYNQAEGAQLMGVSRPSFGRILRNARKVVAEALVKGKIIRIRISDVQVGLRSKDVPNKDQLVDGQFAESLIRKRILKFSEKDATDEEKYGAHSSKYRLR
jgi:predicted DNA-binding protein (UPF0251 family)